MFRPVPKNFDVPQLEREISDFWRENEVERLYLDRNNDSEEIFSFLDGPMTANGPVAVHHAWGRTYKDLWQRYNTMLGKRQRYQNGFDGQGLWVEVTVERELGFKSKRDIEAYGIGNFVRKCKESVFSFADLQTRQSRRLGQFMDWANSYYTLSDENNYTIWHFLKTCHQRGLIYLGHDVMPWCTRCGTGLSEHEIATEGYQELTHESVFVRFPLTQRQHESLLVWTTTPWTLTANVAVAVNPGLTYVKARQEGEVYYLAKGALQALQGEHEILEELPGRQLVGLTYSGPFDDLPAGRGAQHTVIPWDEVSEEEGTGLVHIAPGCGKEDFALGKEFGLKVIAPIDQDGDYEDGFGWLTGRSVLDVAGDIVQNLKERGLLYRPLRYRHRYPTCWRCGTELVFRLVDEWFISMDPLREPMMDVARKVKWLPSYGLERELDWLRNMDDWMISKKRYWGLALPFWLCPSRHLNVIGGKDELFERAISGLDQLESPHRPWIDEVKIRCLECEQAAQRIPDVGNVWLDAGIVPYSTLHYDTDRTYWQEWFPADFITESFPGQFRNWFYSMLAMSTVLENTNPFKTVLGYALMRDAHGREMHKSWGNFIAFDEAAERTGADVMRWLSCLHNPDSNLNFGWEPLEDVKRRLLVLWNTYSFFVTYASLDGWIPHEEALRDAERPLMDRWILARLNQLIGDVRLGLNRYEAMTPARNIETFLDDLSTWYVRRSRRRFWKAENDADKVSAYQTLYDCLTTVARLLAPFMPYLAEILYQNLVRSVARDAPLSVHLTTYPEADKGVIDEHILEAMDAARKVVELGRAARDRVNIKTRQPLARIFVKVPHEGAAEDVAQMKDIILGELNIKELQFATSEDEFVAHSIRPNLPLLGPRYGKEMRTIRSALEAMDPEVVARAVDRGEPVQVSANGKNVELQPSEILTSARERAGYASMAGGGFLVALDTHLDPQLLREGTVREVVRRINEWRKEAGFSVEDRIAVRFEASSDLAQALEEYKTFICQEVLATSLVAEAPKGDGFVAEAKFDGERLRVELERLE